MNLLANVMIEERCKMNSFTQILMKDHCLSGTKEITADTALKTMLTVRIRFESKLS